jgi:sec-independent protein translocase protein TatA
MGQLGFGEIMVIALIALLVFGPKKLPELGKSLGKGLREFKKATDDIKSSFDEHIRDAESTIQDVKKDFDETERDMKAEFYAKQTPPPPDTSATETSEAKPQENTPDKPRETPEETTVPKEQV